MERANFQVGDVVVGTYWIGYNPRYKYFRVKSHTKSGAPRVRELKSMVTESHSTPVDSTTVHILDPSLEEIGDILSSRWSTKDEKWGISIPFFNDKLRASLEPYVPGTSNREDSYY